MNIYYTQIAAVLKQRGLSMQLIKLDHIIIFNRKGKVNAKERDKKLEIMIVKLKAK